MFPKGSLTLLQLGAMVSHTFQVSFSFSLCLFFPAQTASFLQAEHPLFVFTRFQQCASFPAITTMHFHLTNHTTALTVVPAQRFPSDYPMLYFRSRLMTAQPPGEGFVFCTVPNPSTSPQTPVTL